MKFSHIAPELVEGESKQTPYIDMFAVGGIIYKIADSQQFSSCINHKKIFCFLADNCRLV